MAQAHLGKPQATVAYPGSVPIAAVGTSLVVREWTMSGPCYLHVHHSDDEAWHVLEGKLRFRFADGEIEAPAGTTVFVPAGVAHTYSADEHSRYLIILTPKIDRLIEELLDPAGVPDLVATLGAYETVITEPAGERR
jgi:Uncharacterized conserved protein, contains double-stranded beta-helix domain